MGLEIITSTKAEIRTYNDRETTDSFTKAHNIYAEMLLHGTLDEEDIENINAYPKKKPKRYFFTNQPTPTTHTTVDKSYAQITKSSSEENPLQPLDTNNNKISEDLKNTIEFTKKSEERLNNTTQEIIQHIEKEKDSIDQKLKHSKSQLEAFYKDHEQAMEKINTQEKTNTLNSSCSERIQHTFL